MGGAAPLTGQDPKKMMMLKLMLSGALGESGRTMALKTLGMGGQGGGVPRSTYKLDEKTRRFTEVSPDEQAKGGQFYTMPQSEAASRNQAALNGTALQNKLFSNVAELVAKMQGRVDNYALLLKSLKGISDLQGMDRTVAMARLKTQWEMSFKKKLGNVEDTGLGAVMDNLLRTPLADDKALGEVSMALQQMKNSDIASAKSQAQIWSNAFGGIMQDRVNSLFKQDSGAAPEDQTPDE
jgi:hypothetical protein